MPYLSALSVLGEDTGLRGGKQQQLQRLFALSSRGWPHSAPEAVRTQLQRLGALSSRGLAHYTPMVHCSPRFYPSDGLLAFQIECILLTRYIIFVMNWIIADDLDSHINNIYFIYEIKIYIFQ